MTKLTYSIQTTTDGLISHLFCCRLRHVLLSRFFWLPFHRAHLCVQAMALASSTETLKMPSTPSKAPSNKHIIPAEAICVNKQLGVGEFGIVQQGVWTDGTERVSFASAVRSAVESIVIGLLCSFRSVACDGAFPDSSGHQVLEPRAHAGESDGISEGGRHYARHRAREHRSAVWRGARHGLADAGHRIGPFAVAARVPEGFGSTRELPNRANHLRFCQANQQRYDVFGAETAHSSVWPLCACVCAVYWRSLSVNC